MYKRERRGHQSKYKRGHRREKCNPEGEYIRFVRKRNPSWGGEVQADWWRYNNAPELIEKENKLTVKENADFVDLMEISSDFTPRGIFQQEDGDGVIASYEVLGTELFIDPITGKIADFNHDDVDLEVAYGGKTARVELLALLAYEEFTRNSGVMPFQFAFHPVEDPSTGRPWQLGERAINVLGATLEVLNKQPA